MDADNLSAHSLAGFTCCFNSGRICRFCMISYKDLRSHVKEDDVIIRSSQVHQYHLQALRESAGISKQTYGVVSECPFTELNYFDVTKTFPPDLMHNLLEGVVPLVITRVIQALHFLHIVSLSQSVFPKTFTPKLHYLINYPQLILKFGPLKQLWCMRFEGKHQYFKRLAHNTCNFKNLSYTLAKRHQLRQCWELTSLNSLHQNNYTEEQQIDGETLLGLTERMVERLFPVMKHQVTFMKELNKLKKQEQCDPFIAQPWPAVYNLPVFPPELQAALQRKDPGFKKKDKSHIRALLMLHEMTMRFGTDLAKNMETSLNEMALNIIRSAKEGSQRKLYANLIGPEEETTEGLVRNAALILLPALFKENVSFLYSVNSEPKGPTPTIVFNGSPDPLKAESVSIIMDKVNIIREADINMKQAVECLFAVYFLFNVQYPVAIKNTMTFIQKYLLKLKSRHDTRTPTPVLKMYNQLV
ncbi:hypothetical protein IRJ41_007415 [Triplophysa rosa]|uniref:Uncharacterized protein n=1 Tax=Triplophysa rosa TaxID=992332 RepID=A0A9W8CAT3_TRIRA|nr:hypothetical protein IRJ41_007415 [Triplophysa rosa]